MYYAVYKNFVLVDWFFDFFEADFLAKETGGVVISFYHEPPLNY